MEEEKKIPVVRIEINSGTFTIPAGDKLYEITVRQTPTISEALDVIVGTELTAAHPAVKDALVAKMISDAPSTGELQNIALYREITEEMFREIGRLARDLSISIKDLPSYYQKEVDFERAGLDLESAKGMLEEVVKMTETATMTIMDISEDMQEQCTIIKQNLEDVRTLNFVGTAVSDIDSAEKKDPLALMRDTLLNVRRVRDTVAALPPAAARKGASHPAAGRTALSEALAGLDMQIGILEQEYNHQLQSAERYMVVNDSYSMVRKADHDRLISALESSDNVIQCIIVNISRILESLAFQDLSGQRIVKIVDLLSNVQVQLLSILVTSGVKLRRLREGRSLEKTSAASEVDALMSRLKGTDSADGKSKNILDQGAIDSLLEDLGF